MLLDEKVCLVTGAGNGIGRATLDVFLNEGAFVYANDIEAGSLTAYNHNPMVQVLYFDISDEAACKNAIIEINKAGKGLDVLVNNAGIMEDAVIGTISSDYMKKIFETNVYGTIYLLQLASKLMMRAGSGSIINLSSVVGITGNPGQVIYSATKGAIISLTKTAAKELAPRGIRVNAIAPGMIDTDMMRSIGEEHLSKHIDNIPCGRLGTPEEIANACLFLASELSSYVTGHILSVDASVVV